MHIHELKSLIIFQNMSDTEIADCLKTLSSVEKSYKKGAVILNAGEPTEKMGLVLSGSITIENNDIWGNRTILTHVEKGGSFAETYALADNSVLLVDVIANEDCRILFMNTGGLILNDRLTQSWKLKIITNLLTISTHKNLALSMRSFHTAPKNIRGRVLAYLNSISLQKHSMDFTIPFDRQQLADYLNVERTALSKELSKMQSDGLIRCRKNNFTLNTTQ